MNQSKRYPNPWHKDDPVKFSTVLRRWKLDYPWDEVDKATKKLLLNGKLTMVCGNCQTESVAGPWCWKCGRMVRPDRWIGAKSVAPDGRRRRGRPSKAELALAIPVCKVCV